jgi:sugar O-acyltransferase (sialic acid O-acetyltransferase NeuD family)
MDILIIGSSGQGGVILDILKDCGHSVAGYLDDTVPVGGVKRGLPILGKLADCREVCEEKKIQNVALAIGDNWWRRKVWEDLTGLSSVNFPLIAHPTASISRSARIGEGSILMAGAIVAAHARLGIFTIVNTGASLDHDCVLGDFASLAPGVCTGGFSEIGECSAIGVGAVLSDRIKVGSHTVVGTGAVVVRDIPGMSVAYGSPATVVRSRTPGEPYYGSLKSEHLSSDVK